MRKKIVRGVYPTMITPFNQDRTIDFDSLYRLVEWYIQRGINGLFAVCQSSAMFELTLDERKSLCRNVVEMTSGRYPVMASGHISDSEEEQYAELMEMAEAGADALVLVTNRLARENESDEVWLSRLDSLINRLPSDIPLGFYECPYPYKRLLSAQQIRYLVDTGRFEFIKDTCCDPKMIKERAELSQGSKVLLYNANGASLLYSLQQGYSGYSGIMTNFHSDLYYHLCHTWKSDPETAQELQDYLGSSSVIERQLYPQNAKYSLQKEGVLRSLVCRRSGPAGRELTLSEMLEVDQFFNLSKRMSEKYKIDRS